MRVHKTQLQNGQLLPLLVRQDPFQPILVPLIYAVIRLKGKAENTQRNILTSLKYFYQFVEDELGQDPDELIITGKLQVLISYLDQFSYWLIEFRHSKEINQTDTKDAHLRNLKDYLLWTAIRYCKNTYQLDEWSKRIKNVISSSLTYTPAKRFIYKSLSENEVNLIEQLIFPGNQNNPFRGKNKFRNYLIIQLFLNTGIRLGELQKIQCADIYKFDNGNYYIEIREHEDDPFEMRRNKPSLKNQYSQRTISISEELYNSCQHYIRNLRRPSKNGQPMKVKNGYLFLSERGAALSASTIDVILKTISSQIRKTDKTFPPSLSAHIFRHTFAENFLRYLIDILCIDMERAKDQLRVICGWSLTSTMPVFYSARYISLKANQENLKRIETAQNGFKRKARQ